MKIPHQKSRRAFIKNSALAGAASLLAGMLPLNLVAGSKTKFGIPLYGHVWVYASQFPPNWDCTPILPQVFQDFKAAGLEGIELMESNLRNPDIVNILNPLIQQYEVPITGTSYYGDMWNQSQHAAIIEDVQIVVERLAAVGGHTFGITVGDAGRKKTQAELDAQASLLKRVMQICESCAVQPNLHNHTFEVENELHDFRGTIERVPELKLGPDINWLIRAGIDPVWFIDTYGDRMIYLHLRDQKASGEWTRSLGEGVTDFQAIAKALERKGFKGQAAIELAFEEPPTGSVRQEWVKSTAFVREVFEWKK